MLLSYLTRFGFSSAQPPVVTIALTVVQVVPHDTNDFISTAHI